MITLFAFVSNAGATQNKKQRVTEISTPITCLHAKKKGGRLVITRARSVQLVNVNIALHRYAQTDK